MKAMKKIPLILMTTVLVGYAGLAAAAGSAKIAKIHDSIKNEYESVQHLEVSRFETIPSTDVVIFDVRQQSEFEVSHLPGALHVSPDISSREFISTFSEMLTGKTVIFYCSVGQRSSNLAERVQGSLSGSATNGIYNLQGGIFNWHNQKRALVSEAGATDFVHPYNNYWGRLLERPEMIRYQLEN
jgi:rhodanese-related sulfurtransferase